MTKRQIPAFEELTEATGIPLSAEGASMMYTRYVTAAELGEGGRVLEIGCGAGQGLGLLARRARSVVGGDISLPLLRGGARHYGTRVPLLQLSAEALPFQAGSFDLVLFFEASYYVPNMEAAFDEIVRVLGPGGRIFFVNANPERPDFIRSPHSVHYHTAAEFVAALARRGVQAEVVGAFPVDPEAGGAGTRLRGVIMKTARKVLEALHLVPRTLRGRARLKRLLGGRLIVVPPEISEGFASRSLTELLQTTAPVQGYKVLYVFGRRGC